jgi:hypothetical protein
MDAEDRRRQGLTAPPAAPTLLQENVGSAVRLVAPAHSCADAVLPPVARARDARTTAKEIRLLLDHTRLKESSGERKPEREDDST